MKRNWLVTGISGGLGREIALAALQQGDQVMGTTRTKTGAEAFSALAPGRSLGVVMDPGSEDSIESFGRWLSTRGERIDVLVNNAGYGIAGAVEEVSMSEAREIFEVNFFAPFLMLQQVLPIMREARLGHIIQISSHTGFKSVAGFGVYSASKFALEGISEALAQELKPMGIAVTVVEPGPFRTGFAGNNFRQAEHGIADYENTAGVFRERMRLVDGKQEGDPVKAAAVIMSLVQMPDPPLRLPLGNIALGTIQSKLDQVAADLHRTRELAATAVFGAGE